MLYKIRKVGNSFGIILPKKIVEPFLEIGYIELDIETKEITARIVKPPVPRIATEDDVLNIPIAPIVKDVRTAVESEKPEPLELLETPKPQKSRRTPFDYSFCGKHKNTYKGRCGCK